MKKTIFILFILLGQLANAQFTKNDIVGSYRMARVYSAGLLIYDIDNPEKANENVLRELKKMVAIEEVTDSTIAIELFYKDLFNNRYVVFDLRKDGILFSRGHVSDRAFEMREFTEKWDYFPNKHKLFVYDAQTGKIRDKFNVKEVNKKPVIVITTDDMVLELEKYN